MMKFDLRYWLRFSLFNLLIVAALGVLMRYKIGFYFPYFNQKNILHAHSHFAFVGWITHTVYTLMVNFINNKVNVLDIKRYKLLITANLICAYGMLFSFFVSGYGIISIILSTLTIVVACFFAGYFFKDLKMLSYNDPSKAWFKAALWFNIVSSIGTFYLAYMIISANFNFSWYLASIYFYLHFQYNGFFIFACMGLALYEATRLLPGFKYDKKIFYLFFSSAIPAYFLSTLWAKLPLWLYVIVVIAAFMQVAGWFIFVKDIRKALKPGADVSLPVKYLFFFVFIAFSVKLLLQLGSTIPQMNTLAFGFRPVVIAYLHLVLLAVISVFLLSYLYSVKFIQNNKWTIAAISIFILGVLFNELTLAIQGLAAFSYTAITHINEILFAAALVLMLGAFLLVISQKKKAAEIKL